MGQTQVEITGLQLRWLGTSTAVFEVVAVFVLMYVAAKRRLAMNPQEKEEEEASDTERHSDTEMPIRRLSSAVEEEEHGIEIVPTTSSNSSASSPLNSAGGHRGQEQPTTVLGTSQRIQVLDGIGMMVTTLQFDGDDDDVETIGQPTYETMGKDNHASTYKDEHEHDHEHGNSEDVEVIIRQAAGNTKAFHRDAPPIPPIDQGRVPTSIHLPMNEMDEEIYEYEHEEADRDEVEEALDGEHAFAFHDISVC